MRSPSPCSHPVRYTSPKAQLVWGVCDSTGADTKDSFGFREHGRVHDFRHALVPTAFAQLDSGRGCVICARFILYRVGRSSLTLWVSPMRESHACVCTIISSPHIPSCGSVRHYIAPDRLVGVTFKHGSIRTRRHLVRHNYGHSKFIGDPSKPS